MELIEKKYMDDTTGEIVASKYFINGREVSIQEYSDVLEADEDNYETKEDCDGNCENCDLNDKDEEETIEELVDNFANDLISELENVFCPHCQKEIIIQKLYELVDEVEECILNDLDED